MRLPKLGMAVEYGVAVFFANKFIKPKEVAGYLRQLLLFSDEEIEGRYGRLYEEYRRRFGEHLKDKRAVLGWRNYIWVPLEEEFIERYHSKDKRGKAIVKIAFSYLILRHILEKIERQKDDLGVLERMLKSSKLYEMITNN